MSGERVTKDGTLDTYQKELPLNLSTRCTALILSSVPKLAKTTLQPCGKYPCTCFFQTGMEKNGTAGIIAYRKNVEGLESSSCFLNQ